MVAFVMQIPPNMNPYYAAATYLDQETKAVLLPKWARILLAVIAGGYVVMFLQCLHLLYIRIITKTFSFYSFTRLNILKIDVPNMTGLVYLFYTSMVLADLTFQQLIDAGYVSDRHKLPLFGIKFAVVLAGSWAFLWVCFCQCLTSLWDKSWCSVSPQKRTSALPTPLRWMLNGLFICLSLWSLPAFFVTFIGAEQERQKLRELARAITSDLRLHGKTANVTNYRRMDLLLRLIPAKQLTIHRDRMAHWLRLGITAALVDLIVLCVIYVPLLVISIRAIRKKTRECTFSMATCTAEQSVRFRKIERRLKEDHRTLVHHAIMVYISTSIFIPVVVLQLSYKGPTFVQNEKWLILTQIGLHGPFAITGNIVEWVLNKQARRTLRIHREVKQACQRSNKEKESCSSRQSTDMTDGSSNK